MAEASSLDQVRKGSLPGCVDASRKGHAVEPHDHTILRLVRLWPFTAELIHLASRTHKMSAPWAARTSTHVSKGVELPCCLVTKPSSLVSNRMTPLFVGLLSNA